MAPPPRIQRQQQLARLTIGSADSTPMKRPPSRTAWVIPRPHSGWPRASVEGSIVVLASEVRDQLLALHVAQSVLQFHQLNEQIMLRVHLTRMHRRFEVERQPLLNPRHAGAFGEIKEERRIHHNRRCKDAVAAEEVDLELHRIAKPSDQIDVV